MALDPTRSITLRKQFAAAGARRYKALANRITGYLERRSDSEMVLFGPVGSLEQVLRQTLEQQFAPRQFDEFPIQGFLKGIRVAYSEVRQAQLQQPAPPALKEFTRRVIDSMDVRQSLSQLTSRFILELGAVNEALITSILREVSRLPQNEQVRQVRRIVKEQAEKIGRSRFTILAHDTVIRLHAEGQLAAFNALGIQRMQSVPELTSITAGDNRVCSVCRDVLVVKIDDAHNLLPRHAKCRCRWGLLEVDKKILRNRSRAKPRLERTLL